MIKGVDFSRVGWTFVPISAGVECCYYLLLTKAYEKGDFSLVYPLARGSAPVLIAIWAMLFLKEEITLGGLTGIALVAFGIYIINIRSLSYVLHPIKSLRERPTQLALLTGLSTSIYSLIDKTAVAFVPPSVYIVLLFGGIAILLAPYLWISRGKAVMIEEFRGNWGRIIAVGAMNIISYFLVLYVMTLSKVSYVGAIREISIVFGALIGWLLLKEDFGPIRTLAALLMATGITLISIFG